MEGKVVDKFTHGAEAPKTVAVIGHNGKPIEVPVQVADALNYKRATKAEQTAAKPTEKKEA